ncbi:MAG: tyrosine-type recombinase/integrase [Capsulimonadaceae bacterium]|nr:tyrosine-type recombinase/integrase [Capsulimonadaceae bacterium]
MRKTPPRFTVSEAEISASDLRRAAEGWLLDGDIRQHSSRTQGNRREIVEKLLWFLDDQKLDVCGVNELRRFLAYVTRGHEDPRGRWGNPRMKRPVRPRTVHTYHGHLRTLFRWLVAEGMVEQSPMEPIAPPVARADQIQPFTEPQIQSLIATSSRTTHPKRDEAIVLFLLDSGVRASELCGITMRDLDMQGRRCTVLGKGNKHRSVCFGKSTARAIWNYLREDPREPNDPLFLSDRGETSGEPLTRSGLLQLVERLGRAARIDRTRCSPHTFRHTFAVTFLRNGGNVFTLQQILGHTSLHMTNRYVAVKNRLM